MGTFRPSPVVSYKITYTQDKADATVMMASNWVQPRRAMCCDKLAAMRMMLTLVLVICSMNAAEVRTRVRVNVHCDDVPIAEQLQSYLGRELRSLGDVDVSDDQPDYTISAAVVPIQKTFVAVSFIVMMTTPWKPSKTLQAKLTSGELETLKGLTVLPKYL